MEQRTDGTPPLDSFRLIGFCGPAQSGKTTAAGILEDALVDRYGYGRHRGSPGHPLEVHRGSFAARIKRGLGEMGITKDDQPDLYRRSAQVLGTDIVRDHDPDFWVKVAEDDFVTMGESSWDKSVVIVDDVRFGNEVDLIRKYGGFVVLMDPKWRIDLSKSLYDHPSESLAINMLNGRGPGPDFVVNASRPISTYESQLEDLMLMLEVVLDLPRYEP